jgi:hypothetical protein
MRRVRCSNFTTVEAVLTLTAMTQRPERPSVLAVAIIAALIGPVSIAMAGTTSATTPEDTAPADAVLEWTAIAEDTVAADRGPGPAQVLMATVQVAIHDTVVAIEGGSAPYGVDYTGFDEPVSLDAAVATAAHGVLVARVPEQASAVGRLYREYLESVPASEREQLNGIALGVDVADTILELRAPDGFGAVVPYEQPASGPGVFEPVAEDEPVGVNLGHIAPFAMASADQFRPDGPNPLDSPEYAAEFAEVRDLGRLDSEERTPEQTETALFWSDHGFLQWSRTVRAIAADAELGAGDSARLLAMTHVAAADATIGCFEAKYHYLFWRPVHAIPAADSDSNSDTQPDPTWEAELTANHPEYPSGAACVNAAITTTVASFFGTDEVPFDVSSEVTNSTRHFERLSDALDEDLDARVWSGLHFRSSMTEGAELGEGVAQLVTDTMFAPT